MSELPEEGVRKTEPDLPARRTEPDLEPAAPIDPENLAEPEYLDEAAEAALPKATKPKSWVYFLIGGLLFASVAGPLAFYFFVWRYKPTAVQHIPAGSTIAVRFDGAELYASEPFRKHVLSTLEDAHGVESYADRIKSRTGIDLRTDLREIVVATTTGQSFVVLLGGKLGKMRMEQDRFPAGVHAVLTEKGGQGFSMDGDQLVGPGWRVAQSDDDTVIIGTDAEIVRAALEPSDTYKTLGLASSGAMSFVVDAPAVSAASRRAAGATAVALGKTDRISGYFRLNKSKLMLDLVPSNGVESSALGKDYEDALVELRALTVLLPDSYGEKAALEAARVKPRPETLMIETEWPREGIERAFEQAGAALRTILAGSTTDSPLTH